MESNTPLDAKATFNRLHYLAQEGHLDHVALERSLVIIGHVPPAKGWARFLNTLLLGLGAALSVSGIFFFFAFNWDALSDFFKFGLIEALILLAIILATYLGLDTMSGKITLTVASLLIGALLAVFGQVYQTGADYYGLFLTWAILISVWVIISQFSPLWLVFLGLLNLSMLLYWAQVLGDSGPTLNMALFLLNGLALSLWEFGQWRMVSSTSERSWLHGRWWPNLVALLIFIILVVPTVNFISNSFVSDQALIWMMPLLYLLFLFFAIVFYIYSMPDLLMLTMAAFSIIIVLTTAVAQLFSLEQGFEYLILSVLVTGQAALAVTWLRRIDKFWEQGS